MKDLTLLTRKELLTLPKRKAGDDLKEYSAIILVPYNRHESGWERMAVIGCKEVTEPTEIVAYGDDVLWQGELCTPSGGYPLLRTDMLTQAKSIRIRGEAGLLSFTVSGNNSVTIKSKYKKPYYGEVD